MHRLGDPMTRTRGSGTITFFWRSVGLLVVLRVGRCVIMCAARWGLPAAVSSPRAGDKRYDNLESAGHRVPVSPLATAIRASTGDARIKQAGNGIADDITW